jgi:uncharacterized protein (TIGR03437 family)
MLRTLPTCCSFHMAGGFCYKSSVKLLYLLGTAVTLAAAPSITGVYNAGSWIPPSLPNSGLAQGAYFTITGNNLGPDTLVVAGSYPLQTTQGLGGTVVQATVGGVTETCIMYYSSVSQVSAILPSATPIGTGTMSVTYQGAATTVAIQVVAASFGMFTLNSAGSGPASVTDLQYNPITMVNAAHPGDTLVLWGTGLGAVTGDETEPPTTFPNFPGVQVLIENQLVTPIYAGRSSYPGLDQIDVTIPVGISGGCKTSIGVVVNGVMGNVVSTSISPAGQATCGDTFGIMTAANMTKAAANGSLNLGLVDLSRVSSEDDLFGGSFANYPLNSLIRSWGGSFGPSIGSCIVYEQVGGTSLLLEDPIVAGLTHLKTGVSLTVGSGTGSVTVDESSTGTYGMAVGTSAKPYISPGTYTVSNGSGGTDVAGFSWSETLPAPVSFVNFPSTVNRSTDLTVTWTDSSAFTLVSVFGYSAVVLNSSQNSYTEFVCAAPSSATQFTIPAAILSLLPTNGYGAFAVPGAGFQVAGIIDNLFSVTGLDVGQFSVFTTSGPVVKVQ